MRYGITILGIGSHPFLEISPDDFDRIRSAKHNLLYILTIEEKLDLLVATYTEFEKELLDLTLRHMVFSDTDWNVLIEAVRSINRRLANLLSAARLYVDQVQHDLNSIYGKDAQVLAEFRSRLSKAYDGAFSYRLMEGLRNGLQHRSLPVRGLRFSSPWNRAKSPPCREYRIIAILDVEALEADKKFKRSLLSELKEHGEEISLTPFVRGYIEILGQLHEDLREMIASDTDTWESILNDVLESAKGPFEGQLTGLGVVVEEGQGIYCESEEIFEDMVRHRRLLVRKNRSFVKISQRYVSGECN